MLERTSGLTLYSLGIVTEDKPEGTDLIKVAPVEEITMSDGVLGQISIKYDVNMPNHQGVKKQTSIEGGVTMVATWIPFGHSNRITAPDVYRNETVMIWRMADTDEYYWTTVMREPGIRKLETVNYGFSNLSGAPDGKTAFDKTSSYWLEVSTRHKYVQLKTVTNDGEPFAYNLKIDTAEGSVTIEDDVNNQIILTSKDNKLTINTNTDVEVNTVNAVINASTKADINTATATINASTSVNINTPITNISDDVKIGGQVTIGKGLSTGASGSGDTSIGGKIQVNGDMHGDANINVSGNVQAGGSVHGDNI